MISYWFELAARRSISVFIASFHGARNSDSSSLILSDRLDSDTQPTDSIIKTDGRNPMFMILGSIRETTLSVCCHQFHPFIQGTPWSTFITHNEWKKWFLYHWIVSGKISVIFIHFPQKLFNYAQYTREKFYNIWVTKIIPSRTSSEYYQTLEFDTRRYTNKDE